MAIATSHKSDQGTVHRRIYHEPCSSGDNSEEEAELEEERSIQKEKIREKLRLPLWSLVGVILVLVSVLPFFQRLWQDDEGTMWFGTEAGISRLRFSPGGEGRDQ